MRLFGAWGSLVFRYDGELISLAAARGGLPGSSDTMMARFEGHPATDSTVAGRTILSRAVQHIVDIETDPAWGRLAGGNARLRGWRSSVQVPMLSGDDVLGIIAVSRAEPGGFSPAEIALLQTFADQAVIAVKNARLLTEIQESNRDLTESLDRQTATADILRAISQAQTDVQPVFEAIADSAMRLFEAGGAAVARYDGELISMVAARGGLPGSADHRQERLQSPHPPTSPPEHAVLTKRVHHVVDVETDPSCGSEFRRHAAERGFRSFVAVPMLRGNDPLGIIVVNRAEPTGFSSDEIALLQTFADQAVIAVENARLLTELEARNRDLTESLDRQTATADILRVISQAQTDVQPVFEAIVRSAVRLCGAQHGRRVSIRRRARTLGRPRGLHAGTARAVAPNVPASRDRAEPSARRSGPAGWCTSLTSKADLPSRVPDDIMANLRSRGAEACSSVPMLRQSEVIGAIGLAHQHGRRVLRCPRRSC